jgi:hypothetical protein
MSERALGIREFCRRYSIGRTTLYSEIAAGRLIIKKLGTRSLIPIDSAEQWFDSLPDGGSPSAANDNGSQDAGLLEYIPTCNESHPWRVTDGQNIKYFKSKAEARNYARERKISLDTREAA